MNEKPMYRVERSGYGECPCCRHQQELFTVVDIDDTELGQSWGDRELVDDICEYMNMAHERARESGRES